MRGGSLNGSHCTLRFKKPTQAPLPHAGEEMRPVKLRCVVRGYNPVKTGQSVGPVGARIKPRMHALCGVAPPQGGIPRRH